MNDMDYQLRPELRQTYAKILAYESPEKFRYAVQHRKESAAFSFGIAGHVSALEHDTFADRFVVAPDINKRTNAGKAEWAEFCQRADAEKKQVVTQEEKNDLIAMRHALQCHKLAWSLIAAPGETEREIFWEWNGVKCKAKLDKLTADGWVVDYKTARDASPFGFQRDFYRFRYHFQAAWYRAAALSLGRKIAGVAYIAQEKAEPYSVVVYTVPELALLVGSRDAERALELFKACKAANSWPGYSEEAIELGVPSWVAGDTELEIDPAEIDFGGE